MSMLALTFTQIKINTECSCYYGQQPGTLCVWVSAQPRCLEIILLCCSAPKTLGVVLPLQELAVFRMFIVQN